jgi:hypothetical protein
MESTLDKAHISYCTQDNDHPPKHTVFPVKPCTKTFVFLSIVQVIQPVITAMLGLYLLMRRFLMVSSYDPLEAVEEKARALPVHDQHIHSHFGTWASV